MNNNRFVVAVHLVALLAVENKTGLTTSECLADSAGTNPVVVRRLLGQLSRAGLVKAQVGTGGGVRLLRPPEQITLLEIYRAVGEKPLLSLDLRKPNPDCFCGRSIRPILGDVFDQIEQAAGAIFAGTTIADLAAEVNSKDALPRAERV